MDSATEEVEGRAVYLYLWASVNAFVMLTSSSKSRSPESSLPLNSAVAEIEGYVGCALRRRGGAKVMGDKERRRALRGDTGMARGLSSGSDTIPLNLRSRKSLRVETGQEGSTCVTSH